MFRKKVGDLRYYLVMFKSNMRDLGLVEYYKILVIIIKVVIEFSMFFFNEN